MIDKTIYVFSTNLAGLHCSPTARHAMEHKGAVWGRGFGPQGMAWAIPTKDWDGDALPLYRVSPFIHEFILFAMHNDDMKFFVTALDIPAKDVVTYFKQSPANVMLPPEYEELL